MQYIIILVISVLHLHADIQKITPAQHSAIHHYNFKAGLKVQEKSHMHQIHKINEAQARKIVKNLLDEDVEALQLTHQSRVLVYKIQTKNYRVEMNAMDGTIIQKEKRK